MLVLRLLTLDNQGANTIYHWGIYEKYNTGWYSDEDGSTSIKDNKISIPARQGYDFKGFYTKTNGSGEQIIDQNGYIKVNSNRFTSNTIIYAYWKSNAPVTTTIYPTGFCAHKQCANVSDDVSGTCMYTNHNVNMERSIYTCPKTHKNPKTGVTEDLVSIGGCGGANVTTDSINLSPGCYQIVYNGKKLPSGLHFIRNDRGEQCKTRTITNSAKTQYYFYAPVPKSGSYYFGIKASASGCDMGEISSVLTNVEVTRVGEINDPLCAGSIYNYYCKTMTGTCDEYCNEYK